MPDSISTSSLPVLYSFRRCPYAIRARMTLSLCNIRVELREVDLKRKPEPLLQISPKATVPVLLTTDIIIDESLDIMHWAIERTNNKLFVIDKYTPVIDELIHQNDHIFKDQLDHYKYADRYPEYGQQEYRHKAEHFLQTLDDLLQAKPFLLGTTFSLADLAIFPFIRQFAYVDIEWFKQAPYPHLNRWLEHWLNSEMFTSIMTKYTPWKASQQPVIL